MIYFILTLFFSIRSSFQSKIINSYPLLSQSIQSQLQGWALFSINVITFNGQQAIIVFGGTINETSQNLALVSPINNPNTSFTIQNDLAPQPRYSHCTLSDRDSLYVYGGIGQMGESLVDLWQFNTTTLIWKLISISSFKITSCNLIKNGSFLLVLGINSTSYLQIWQYSFTSNNWLKILYNYGYGSITEGMTWQKTVKKTLTNFSDLPQSQNISKQNMVYKTQLFIANFHTISEDNSIYYIVSNKHILFLNLSSSMTNITWVNNIQIQNQQFQCQITKQWLFIISKNTQFLFLCYYNLSNFYKSGMKAYKSQEDQYNFISFLIDEDIYFLQQNELDGWILQKDCDQILNNSNILACFYGDVFCKRRYRGQTCQEKNCPNTLALVDLSTFSQIRYQCNNHGVCIDSQCICNKYWSGRDCSTYTRSTCYGQLLDNWPVMNCQCLSQITGGNNCQITFCYNDCNNQGICLPTGECLCNKDYYSEDCSIAIIELDQPVSNI